MAKARTKTFNVQAEVRVWTELPVVAGSLEDAVAVSRSLKLADFVELHGENLDDKLEISGISDPDLPSIYKD